MKLLLTSSGIKNTSIRNALTALLGKPIEESNALFIPSGVYPFVNGQYYAWDALYGKHAASLAQLGWKAVGVLELSVLPSIEKAVWATAVEEADALLVWGGDPVFLSYWMRASGLAELIPSLRSELVYVGVSAGSMATCSTFGEAYTDPPQGRASIDVISTQEISLATPAGEISRTLVTARGIGLVDFAIIPHLNNPNHEDASLENAEKWAAMLPVPVYAIDEQSAIQITDGHVEIISEGSWRLFKPKT
ncbi:MAG TPA: Type 1 glutamine amidotransferase-like domain-containing protein [Candidatus Tumulicola sp.]